MHFLSEQHPDWTYSVVSNGLFDRLNRKDPFVQKLILPKMPPVYFFPILFSYKHPLYWKIRNPTPRNLMSPGHSICNEKKVNSQKRGDAATGQSSQINKYGAITNTWKSGLTFAANSAPKHSKIFCSYRVSDSTVTVEPLAKLMRVSGLN